MSPLHSAFFAALAVASSAAFAADPVYKSTMPDGRIVYGESPMQGAKRVDKVAAPPEHSGVVVVTDQDKARAATYRPETGGVAVIPQRQREAPRSAQQGFLANPAGTLPTR